jgi:hypothetical protein
MKKLVLLFAGTFLCLMIFTSRIYTCPVSASAGSSAITIPTKDRPTPIDRRTQNRLFDSLLTAGGNGSDAPPACAGGQLFASLLRPDGPIAYEPIGSYYYFNRSATHKGCLIGPSGVNFDLNLQKRDGNEWVTVAHSNGPDANETISYNGEAGYYRWKIYSVRGYGNYNFWAVIPRD